MIRINAKRELFTGLVGRVVETFAQHTEADPVAIATQFVVACGNAIGRGPHLRVGEVYHFTNEFLALVGPSARGRKGDALAVALRALRDACHDWYNATGGGLSSGEGVVFAVRDRITREGKDGVEIEVDPGAEDKRLLVTESEFSTALKQFEREGNTLSNVLRDAWDGKYLLRVRTRKDALRATEALVSVIAHTTPADLHRYLGTTECANGLGNRFMFVAVQRAKLLPSPGRAEDAAVTKLVEELETCLRVARGRRELRRTPDAETMWTRLYADLTADRPGLAGQLLARAETHVCRLALIYALLDGAAVIDVPHLKSALAFWDCVEESTLSIFGDRSGDDTADRILDGMLPGDSMTLKEMREQIFANHVTGARLSAAIDALRTMGKLTVATEDTAGRPRIVVTRMAVEVEHGQAAHVA